jgi:CheY-like chemotaxis protein
MSLQILYVDGDTELVESQTPALAAEGFEVVAAPSGVRGLAAAREKVPDLVLAEVDLPDMTGWNFIRLLRAEPKFAFVPVLFLTAQVDESLRIRGFRMGADDVLTKPVSAEDLALRIARVLADGYRIENEVRRRPSGSGLQGPLEDVGLSTLLTIFELERLGGVLTIRHSETMDVGRIYLRGGYPIRARIDGDGAPRNRDAVYAMLRWGTGEFEFRGCYIAGDNEIAAGTMHLLIEGARQLDERAFATEDAADEAEEVADDLADDVDDANDAEAAAAENAVETATPAPTPADE